MQPVEHDVGSCCLLALEMRHTCSMSNLLYELRFLLCAGCVEEQHASGVCGAVMWVWFRWLVFWWGLCGLQVGGGWHTV
jgi:hypothetical protein